MSIPSFSLVGQRALVTGGRRGIGRSIALAFAEAGADVAVCDLVIDDGQLESVAEEIQRHGRRSLAVQADTSRKGDVENVVKRAIKEFGAIDILVNNAGIVATGPFLDLSEEEWDRVVNVNLKGYYLCAQTVGKTMVGRKKGNIVNIASHAAFEAIPGMGVYCVSKAGVAMLTRVLARELGSYGIRANAIAPGIVKTEMSRYDWENAEFRRQREAAIPLGRLAEIIDLVGITLFLASDASNYITGHTVVVDGGEMT